MFVVSKDNPLPIFLVLLVCSKIIKTKLWF